MNSQRLGGLALILGAAGVIAVLAVHPHDTGFNLDRTAANRLADTVSYVHAGALVCVGLMLFGLATFSRLLGFERASALAGLTTYAIGAAAIVSGAVVGGFGEAALTRGYASASAAAQPMIRTVFRYNSILDDSFGSVFAYAASAAVLIWSLGLLREKGWRALGGFGAIAGLACLVGLTAMPSLKSFWAFHVFLGSFALQMIWVAWTGVNLLLKRDAFAR
jgi:hypothetical protein